MTAEMKIGSIAPWYGAKRTLAPVIVEQLGPHRCYFEPFCGSMAVLLGKPRATMETVNDLHGDLVNLARTIQHPTEGARFYRRCRRVLFAQALFEESAAVIAQPFAPSAEPDGDRAHHFFVYSWFQRNGVAGSNGGATFCVRYTSGGGQPATRWENAVDSIPAWRDRLRGVVILSECGIEVVERMEDVPGTVAYLDPPYLVKKAKYIHDFKPADHKRLAAAAWKKRHTRIVVSYYDHPDLAALYPGWSKLACPTTKAIVQQGKRGEKGRTEAPEVLLVNGPLYGGALPDPPTDLFSEYA